jgi:hypothetical protein
MLMRKGHTYHISIIESVWWWEAIHLFGVFFRCYKFSFFIWQVLIIVDKGRFQSDFQLRPRSGSFETSWASPKPSWPGLEMGHFSNQHWAHHIFGQFFLVLPSEIALNRVIFGSPILGTPKTQSEPATEARAFWPRRRTSEPSTNSPVLLTSSCDSHGFLENQP